VKTNAHRFRTGRRSLFRFGRRSGGLKGRTGAGKGHLRLGNDGAAIPVRPRTVLAPAVVRPRQCAHHR
jgi:hypothetical protein